MALPRRMFRPRKEVKVAALTPVTGPHPRVRVALTGQRNIYLDSAVELSSRSEICLIIKGGGGWKERGQELKLTKAADRFMRAHYTILSAFTYIHSFQYKQKTKLGTKAQTAPQAHPPLLS